MTAQDLYDVAIAGYGPTGLAAAALLARCGHRVCVFERWPTLYGQPRVATIDGESARIVQATCDIDRALRNSEPRRRYIFANEAGEALIDHDWGGRDISGFPLRISLHQPDIEDEMDAAARAAGARINQGWEVAAFEQGPDSVVVTVRERTASHDGAATANGRERTVEARYLIGADGARSTVRRLLGVAEEHWPSRAAWYSVDAVRKGPRLPDFHGLSPDGRIAVIFCAPEGRAHSVIPLGTEHLRFNFQVDPDGDHRDKLNTEAAYRHLGEVYGVTADQVEVYRQAIYPFEGRLAERWRHGRVFLAGDAAHVMTPFLGQGGCSALRDAINLAWKLDLVLRGFAGDTLLDSCETERKPHVRVYVEGSDRLAAVTFVDDPEAAAARDRRLREGGALPAPVEPTIGAGILQRSTECGTASPVGVLGPQGVIRRGGREGRFDDIAGFGFQLVAAGHDPAAGLDDDRRAFLEWIRCASVGVGTTEGGSLWVDADGVYTDFLRRYGVEAILLRPDFTVFGAARTAAGVPGLIDDLRAALG